MYESLYLSSAPTKPFIERTKGSVDDLKYPSYIRRQLIALDAHLDLFRARLQKPPRLQPNPDFHQTPIPIPSSSPP